MLPRLGTGDVCLSILPYFHAGGLLTAFVMLAQGVRLVVWGRFERERFFEIVDKHNVSNWGVFLNLEYLRSRR